MILFKEPYNTKYFGDIGYEYESNFLQGITSYYGK